VFKGSPHLGPQFLHLHVQRRISAEPGQYQTELMVLSHTKGRCLLHILQDHGHGTALQQIVHAAHEKYELYRSRQLCFPEAVQDFVTALAALTVVQ
jgi:hypothetical protein